MLVVLIVVTVVVVLVVAVVMVVKVPVTAWGSTLSTPSTLNPKPCTPYG